MTRRSLATLSLTALCLLLAVPSWAGKRAPRARTWVHDFRADTLGLAPSGTNMATALLSFGSATRK